MRDSRPMQNEGGGGDTFEIDGLGAGEVKALRDENANAVQRSSQVTAPYTGVGEDLFQQGRAMMINALAAQVFIDSGTANNYVVTPLTGVNGLVTPNHYDQLNGAIISCVVANTNIAGACYLNFGQEGGALLGNKKLLDQNGLALLGGEILSGDRIQIVYDPNADTGAGAWLLIGRYNSDNIIGMPRIWIKATPPTNHLVLDGSILDKNDFPRLFAVYGYTFGGSGDDFWLPDFRGVFLRGWDNGRGLDIGRVLNTLQAAFAGSFTFAIETSTVTDTTPNIQVLNKIFVNGTEFNNDPTPVTIDVTPGDTRPVNESVVFITKYQ